MTAETGISCKAHHLSRVRSTRPNTHGTGGVWTAWQRLHCEVYIHVSSCCPAPQPECAAAPSWQCGPHGLRANFSAKLLSIQMSLTLQTDWLQIWGFSTGPDLRFDNLLGRPPSRDRPHSQVHVDWGCSHPWPATPWLDMQPTLWHQDAPQATSESC